MKSLKNLHSSQNPHPDKNPQKQPSRTPRSSDQRPWSPRTPVPIQTTVVNHTHHRLPQKFLKDYVAWVAQKLHRDFFAFPKKLKKLPLGLTLTFLSPSQIRDLNGQFRSRPYPTDILSFSFLSSPPDGLPTPPSSMGQTKAPTKNTSNRIPLPVQPWGELIICPQMAKKQSLQNAHSFRDELAYLVLHGILHLLGYDHENGGSEEILMMGLQDKIFEEFLGTFHRKHTFPLTSEIQRTT